MGFSMSKVALAFLVMPGTAGPCQVKRTDVSGQLVMVGLIYLIQLPPEPALPVSLITSRSTLTITTLTRTPIFTTDFIDNPGL
jgi:hypothetical protein